MPTPPEMNEGLITAGGEGITPKLERPAPEDLPLGIPCHRHGQDQSSTGLNLGVFCASRWARWGVGKGDCSNARGEVAFVAGTPGWLLTSCFSVPQFHICRQA